MDERQYLKNRIVTNDYGFLFKFVDFLEDSDE